MTESRFLYAVDAKTRDRRGLFQAGDRIVSPPTVSEGVVYLGSRDGNFYDLDIETGLERWRVQTGATNVYTPTIADGVVYFGTEDRFLYAVW